MRKGGQEGCQGGQEGRQGGQEGRSALLFWPSWNTVWVWIFFLFILQDTSILDIHAKT